jgi:hypothetical protein
LRTNAYRPTFGGDYCVQMRTGRHLEVIIAYKCVQACRQRWLVNINTNRRSFGGHCLIIRRRPYLEVTIKQNYIRAYICG